MDIFTQIGPAIISGAVIAALGSYIKQPVILGYILAGILLGPTVTGMIADPELINTVSHIGIMLLLFLIGLEMGVEKLKDIGLVSLAAGAGQVIFTGLIGFGILIVQDLLAIMSLLILAGFGEGSFAFDPSTFGMLLLKGGALALGAGIPLRP